MTGKSSDMLDLERPQRQQTLQDEELASLRAEHRKLMIESQAILGRIEQILKRFPVRRRHRHRGKKRE